MRVKDIFEDDKQESVYFELREFLSQDKNLSGFLNNSGSVVEAQLVFGSFILLSFNKNKMKTKLFIEFQNMLKGDSYFEIKKSNVTPSLIKCVEKELREFQDDVKSDITGESALKTLKLINPRSQIKLNKFINLIDERIEQPNKKLDSSD